MCVCVDEWDGLWGRRSSLLLVSVVCVCVFVCCLPSVCVKREEKRAKSKAKAKSSESDDLHWLFPTRRSTQSKAGKGAAASIDARGAG